MAIKWSPAWITSSGAGLKRISEPSPFMASTITPDRLTKAGCFQGLAAIADPACDQDFFDLQRVLLVHRGIEEIHHVRTHERLGDAISGEIVGRNDGIGARGQQVLFGVSSLARAMIFRLGLSSRAVRTT